MDIIINSIKGSYMYSSDFTSIQLVLKHGSNSRDIMRISWDIYIYIYIIYIDTYIYICNKIVLLRCLKMGMPPFRGLLGE